MLTVPVAACYLVITSLPADQQTILRLAEKVNGEGNYKTRSKQPAKGGDWPGGEVHHIATPVTASSSHYFIYMFVEFVSLLFDFLFAEAGFL